MVSSIHEHKKQTNLPLASGSTLSISMVGWGVPEALHFIVKEPPSTMEISWLRGTTWSIRAGTILKKYNCLFKKVFFFNILFLGTSKKLEDAPQN